MLRSLRRRAALPSARDPRCGESIGFTHRFNWFAPAFAPDGQRSSTGETGRLSLTLRTCLRAVLGKADDYAELAACKTLANGIRTTFKVKQQQE